MALKNPFASQHPKDNTVNGPLDQRLFSSAPPHQAQEQPPQPKPVPVASTDSPEPTRVELKPASLKRTFDLNEQALYQMNPRFTQEELEALEDIKLELSRELDQKVGKGDLVRCGVHLLIEDYKAKGPANSYARRKISQRRSK